MVDNRVTRVWKIELTTTHHEGEAPRAEMVDHIIMDALDGCDPDWWDVTIKVVAGESPLGTRVVADPDPDFTHFEVTDRETGQTWRSRYPSDVDRKPARDAIFGDVDWDWVRNAENRKRWTERGEKWTQTTE